MVEIKNILCAVDFSEISPKVASYAQALAMKLKANVHVLYVAPSMDQYGSFHVPSASIWDFVGGTVANVKMMDTFIKDNFNLVNATGKVLSGDAAEKILDFAQSENIDLIITGTHGRRGFDKYFFGSVAEKVVKSSKIPVLSIRP